MTVELAHLSPGDRVLDVGCGTGSLTIAIKKCLGQSGEVYGIDPASQMIQLARKKASKADVDINFKVGVIEDLPFPDKCFDVVLSSFMVHHLPGDELKSQGFAEIKRVLKPGGKLLVVDIDRKQKNAKKYSTLLKNTGFSEVKIENTNYKTISFIRAKSI